MKNVNELHDAQLGIGDTIADTVASFIGSWRFIIGQACIMLLWIIINVLVLLLRFDPYPFVFLNLAMSAEAAFSAPIIMMSQNRQSDKDRITADETHKAAMKDEEETRNVMQHLSQQDEAILRIETHILEVVKRLETKENKRGTKQS